MGDRLNKGFFGEQGAGFFLGSKGYFFVEGPSGAGGHAANASGFDGLAFNPVTVDLILLDNKTFASDRNVSSASAIDPAANLAQNLDRLISRVQQASDLPRQAQILDLLRRTRSSLTTKGVTPPANVRIAVTNFGGRSPGVTQQLRDRGLIFIDMNAAPEVPKPSERITYNTETIPEVGRLQAAGAGEHNARAGKMEAAAIASATVAQMANDAALNHAIKAELGRLAGDISETLVTKGSALVVIVVSCMSSGNVGTNVARSLTSTFIFGPASGLPRQQAIERHRATPAIGAYGGAGMETEIFYCWYGPTNMQ
jgi:hypothetical protein